MGVGWLAADSVEIADETTPEQRRADAVGLLAERALAAGFGGSDSVGHGSADYPAGRDKDGGNRRGHADGTVSGSRAERYQVVLHVDVATLNEDGKVGRSELEDGTRVSAETSRRLACDSGVAKIGSGPPRSVIPARGPSHSSEGPFPAAQGGGRAPGGPEVEAGFGHPLFRRGAGVGGIGFRLEERASPPFVPTQASDDGPLFRWLPLRAVRSMSS